MSERKKGRGLERRRPGRSHGRAFYAQAAQNERKYSREIPQEVPQNQIFSRCFYIQLIPSRGALPDLTGFGS